MVGVAQLVEPQVVALVVVGSSPITHPIDKLKTGQGKFDRLCMPGILAGFIFNFKWSQKPDSVISYLCEFHSACHSLTDHPFLVDML